jgi:predicted  nucleic acid-binding Zn-ribbon protein
VSDEEKIQKNEALRAARELAQVAQQQVRTLKEELQTSRQRVDVSLMDNERGMASMKSELEAAGAREKELMSELKALRRQLEGDSAKTSQNETDLREQLDVKSAELSEMQEQVRHFPNPVQSIPIQPHLYFPNPIQAKPSQAKPSQAKPSQAKPGCIFPI